VTKLQHKRFDIRESCVQQCATSRRGEQPFCVTVFAAKHHFGEN